MMDLPRAHPLTVVNGVLYEKPFYARRRNTARAAPAPGVGLSRMDRAADRATLRLQHCIRDSRPSAPCQPGASAERLQETLDIVVDALPSALRCKLLLLSAPKLFPDALAARR